MGRNWVWFAGPAAATTSLFIAVAVFSNDGGSQASPGAVVTETSQPRTATVQSTPPAPTRARTTRPTTTTMTTRPTTADRATTTTTTQATTTAARTTTTRATTGSATTTTAAAATTTAPARTTTRTTATTRRTTTRRARPNSPRTTTEQGRTTFGVVPEVYGLTQGAAVDAVKAAGYRVEVRQERSFQPDGQVFRQVPLGNRRLRRGRTVVLTVSAFAPSGEPPPPPPPRVSSVPRVIGLDYSEAAARMEAIGVVANLYPVRSRTKRVTIVTSQVPVPGRRITPGASVRLTVSIGARPLPSAAVPDTVGLKELTAHELCRDENFLCRTVAVPTRHPRGPGRVVRQRPNAGEAAERLTQMTLFVGK
jgi:beta-lactam-binding protein with PASTA domain